MPINDAIMEFVYNEAAHDAFGQRAYSNAKTWLYDLSSFPVIENVLCMLIDDILKGKYINQFQTVYDNDFINAASIICNELNISARARNASQITFGHAQKIINMIVKYYFVSCYNNITLRDNFKYCHCPMDSNMIGKVFDAYKLKSFPNHKTIKVNGRSYNKSGNNIGFTLIKWSQLNWNGTQPPNEYLDFQSMVEIVGKNYVYKNYPPQTYTKLEIDYLLW